MDDSKKREQAAADKQPVIQKKYLGTSSKPMTAEEEQDNKHKSGIERMSDYYRRIRG